MMISNVRHALMRVQPRTSLGELAIAAANTLLPYLLAGALLIAFA